MGGTVGLEFKNAYKLQRVAQQKTLGILRIEVLSSQVRMNHENFEALIVSSTFWKSPKETQNLLNRITSMPTETVNVGEVMTAKGVVPGVAMVAEVATLEVVFVEVPAKVPKSP